MNQRQSKKCHAEWISKSLLSALPTWIINVQSIPTIQVYSAAVDDVRACVCVRVCVCVNEHEYRVVTKLEYGEAKVGRFFVAPTTAMDIINRDRVRTGMLQVLDATTAFAVWSQVHVSPDWARSTLSSGFHRPICSFDECT